MVADRDAFAKSVIARRETATNVRFESVQLGEGVWVPQKYYCHANVETWVFHNPSHKAVLGYLISEPSPGRWLVYAHSVVEREDGTLIDITPMHGSQSYPFIRHVGTDEESEAMKGRDGTEISNDDC